jgi:hypothetical protein
MSPPIRTVLLWVALVGMFTFFYQVFANGRTGGSEAVSWTRFAPTIGLALAAYAVVTFLGLRTRGAYKLSQEGVDLLARGRYTEALEKFESFCARSTRTAVGPYNVGLAQLMLWRLGAAEEAFAQALKRGKRIPFFKTNAPLLLAVCTALAGRTDTAQRWLDQLTLEARDTGLSGLARAVLACRRGDFSGALPLLDAFEVKQLGGFYLALANALRAWCVAEQTGELRHVDRVALFGETGPEVVRGAWPELTDFVLRAPAA